MAAMKRAPQGPGYLGLGRTATRTRRQVANQEGPPSLGRETPPWLQVAEPAAAAAALATESRRAEHGRVKAAWRRAGSRQQAA